MNKITPSILIASFENANKLITPETDFDSLISLGGEDLKYFESFSNPKLRLSFNDIDLPSEYWTAPTIEHIEKIINFASEVKTNCLIHCKAGKSRSSAAAYILLSKILGPGSEEEAVNLILSSAMEDIFPNGRMVYIADVLLNREEKMWDEYINYFGQIPDHHRDLDLIKFETRKYIIQNYPDSIIKFKGK